MNFPHPLVFICDFQDSATYKTLQLSQQQPKTGVSFKLFQIT